MSRVYAVGPGTGSSPHVDRHVTKCYYTGTGLAGFPRAAPSGSRLRQTGSTSRAWHSPTTTIPQNILKKVKVMRDEASAIVEMATRVLSPALSTWLGLGLESGLA